VRIGLDFDGVISNSIELKIRLLKEFYGWDVPPEAIRGKNLVENYFHSDEEYLRFGGTLYGREYAHLLKPVEGALIYIPMLCAEGHEITVVSSRNAAQLEVAEELSSEWGLALEFIGVGYKVKKAEALARLKAELYADDDFHKLVPLQGVVRYLYLCTQAHNRNDDVGSIAKRADDWPILYQEIQILNGQ